MYTFQRFVEPWVRCSPFASPRLGVQIVNSVEPCAILAFWLVVGGCRFAVCVARETAMVENPMRFHKEHYRNIQKGNPAASKIHSWCPQAQRRIIKVVWWVGLAAWVAVLRAVATETIGA